MDKFSKGEIAIYLAISQPGHYIDGVVKSECECEVISGLLRRARGLFYRCEIPGDPGPQGNGWVIAANQLRKKKPPTESLDITETRKRPASTWDQIKQDCEREKETA